MMEVSRFWVGHSEEHRIVSIPAEAFTDRRARVVALVNGSPRIRAEMPESGVEDFVEAYRRSCATTTQADWVPRRQAI